MKHLQIVEEQDLATLAKAAREAAGKSRAEAARELKVSFASIFNAEEKPERSLVELRRRIIEHYSDFTVSGPEYRLHRKKSA